MKGGAETREQSFSAVPSFLSLHERVKFRYTAGPHSLCAFLSTEVITGGGEQTPNLGAPSTVPGDAAQLRDPRSPC